METGKKGGLQVERRQVLCSAQARTRFRPKIDEGTGQAQQASREPRLVALTGEAPLTVCSTTHPFRKHSDRQIGTR